MSEENSTQASPAKKNPRSSPTASASGRTRKSRFTEIGVAFPHKDGKGFDVLYDAIPLSGRITLRVQEPKE